MNKLNRSLKSTVNLFNSIIGVSILAMPLCFKHCGIVLSILVVCFSAFLNQFSCYLLLKSAIINRRRNYELLAFDVFGSSGKTLVEVCILFFLLGTCIAFFVIVGDIAPSLVAHVFNIENGPHLRALIVTILAMFVIFPLGLLRSVENLTSFSMMSLLVYLFLATRMISLAFDKFITPSSVEVMQEVTYWDSTYVISYLPIFSMALSCQSQIFEIFHPDLFQADLRSLKFMMRSTKRAIYMSSFVYILIGLFGYIAFYDANFSGNILQNLPSGFITKITLLLFLITLLTSFPLCLFPCRTSLHSLLFRKGGYNDLLSTAHSIHMSDHHFRLLTMVLIVTTMGISVIFPHVELVLALVGSTIGAIVCFIIPAMIFIKLSDKNTVEYLLAYLLVFFGAIILVFCTFSALHSISVARDAEIEEKINEIKQKSTEAFIAQKTNAPENVSPLSSAEFKTKIHNLTKLKTSNDINKLKKQEELLQRLEKQQQEHSKLLKEQREIIAELKTHDKIFHDNKDPSKQENLNENVRNGSISVKIIADLPKVEIKENEAVQVKPSLGNGSLSSEVEHIQSRPNVIPVLSEPKPNISQLANLSPLKNIIQSSKLVLDPSVDHKPILNLSAIDKSNSFEHSKKLDKSNDLSIGGNNDRNNTKTEKVDIIERNQEREASL